MVVVFIHTHKSANTTHFPKEPIVKHLPANQWHHPRDLTNSSAFLYKSGKYVKKYLGHPLILNTIIITNIIIIMQVTNPSNRRWLIFLIISGHVESLLLCSSFLWLQQPEVTLHCGARASHGGVFSWCGAQARGTQDSVGTAHRLISCSSWAPEHKSGVVTHGLSCPEAGGILLNQGLNPCALHLQAESQPVDHQGNPTLQLDWILYFCFTTLSKHCLKSSLFSRSDDH